MHISKMSRIIEGNGLFMLFDERDFNVFETNDSRVYFKEILQLYHCQNYRAAIVLLYSFVIYDLYIKLQTMANEGDKKAKNHLSMINDMIKDDEKYSKVENTVISFFYDNCPLYFERFKEDVDYLRNCRNKCAHLKVNDNSLFVPSDYQVRMLVCSMYDNILSVRAPFIMDLFSIAQNDIEHYSQTVNEYSAKLDDTVKETLKNKYLKRMTYDSMKKSYKTFIKLLFVSDDEICEKNAWGLYAFVFALTDYFIKEGYVQIYNEDVIIRIFSQIKIDTIKNSYKRRRALINIMTNFPVVMDVIKSSNESLFDYIANFVLSDPCEISKYRVFYPRTAKTTFGFFMENDDIHKPAYTETLYKCLKESNDFNVAEFMKVMVNNIPHYSGFYIADSFMSSFLDHIEELTIESIEEIVNIYKKNCQCTNRSRHSSDMAKVNNYLEQNKMVDNVDSSQD